MQIHRAMMRHVLLPGCSGLFVFMIACGNPAVPDTRDGDIKAVKNVEAEVVKAVAAKDLDKIMIYDADDESKLLPNLPIITGKDNIKAAWKSFLADPNLALTFQSTRAEASKGGDFVYTIGTYSMTMSNPRDKKPITDNGKYLTVFKKQPDGSWKMVADMLNSDLPLPGAAQ
jgi:ketosteroid isomerase-like protein